MKGATHFSKFRGLKKNMTQTKMVNTNYMDTMIVREHVDKKKNMHPKTKERWNQMTQKPEPLKFKLHQL